MDWTDLTIETPRRFLQQAEAVCGAVSGGGLYIEDYADLEQQVQAIAHIDLIEQELLDKPRDVVRIHLYIAPDQDLAGAVQVLQDRLLAAGVDYRLLQQTVRQEDWENSWKQYYHPVEIGRRLAVAPSWEAYESERATLRLDPGMAFGTGTHETTVLCMEVLDEVIHGGESLLDVGTGSGILGIAALLLGAQSALGIDIDPMCVRTAGENAARNGVAGRFVLREGNLADAAGSERYDIITANIVAAAILQLAPAIPPLLAPGGLFVASGIIDERADEVIAGLGAAGLTLQERRDKNGWVALLARAAG